MKIAAQDFNVQLGASNPGETVLMGGTAAAGSAIVVPGGAWPLQSEFLRQGPDLLISGKAGESYIVRDYFLDGNQAQIQTEGGAVLPASLVERLVKVTAAGQYAQSAGTDSAEIVGRVETVLGKASALRSDGSQLELSAGDAIHAGDILQTSPDASLGIVFADKTTLSLGSEGRLVVDNFVYDPQANVGSMNVSVVQGVFTFVSGEIAKLGPDMMTVYTPVATIGIRGTKVAGRAAAEGEQNTISLLPNDDGSVGVIAVGNQSGAVPQILTFAGATTTVSSQFQAPAQPIVLSQSQIQQQYGAALQTLNQTRQSVQTRQETEPEQAPGGNPEAAPAEGEGPAGEEQSGEQTPADEARQGEGAQEEAGLSEEEQAARDAAEAALREGETPEAVLEAAVEAAADRALAEGASPEEVAEAEASARAAFNEALENGESPENALEAAMASVGESEFSQGQGATGTDGGIQLSRGNDGEDAVLGAAEGAAEAALANGASEEEAFEAAVRAAVDAATARGEDPEEVARIAANVRETHAEAIESGVDPSAAIELAFATAGGDSGGFDAFAPVVPGGGGDVAGIGTFSGPIDGLGSIFSGTTYFANTFTADFQPEFISFEPLVFEAPSFDGPETFVDNGDDQQDNIVDVAEDTTVFADEFVATSGPDADTFIGGAGNTEFVYSQSEDGDLTVNALDGSGGAFNSTGVFTDLITDTGGASDRITFEDLDGVGLKMSNVDSSFVEISIFYTGGSASASSLTGSAITTIHVSRDVEDLQGSVTNLASLDEGIIVKGALDVTGDETAFILAGSSGSDTLSVDDANAVGALLFGKGGDDTLTGSEAKDDIMFGGDDNDTLDGKGGENSLDGGAGVDSFNVTSNSGSNSISGGADSDTVFYSSIGGSVNFDFTATVSQAVHGSGRDSYDSVEAVSGSGNGDTYFFEGGSAAAGIATITGGSGDDTFFFDGNASTSATILGGGGNDTFLFVDQPGSPILIGDLTTGVDKLVFDKNFFSGADDGSGSLISGRLSIDGSPALGGAGFRFNTSTKLLQFDIDGSGSTLKDIATLTGATLVEADIAFQNVVDVTGTSGVTMTAITDVILGSNSTDIVTLSGTALAGDIFDGGDSSLSTEGDSLTLDNGANILTVYNTELITGGTGTDNITLATAMLFNTSSTINTTIDLGAGVDSLTLTAGINDGFIFGVETINGSAFDDELHLENNLTGGTTTVDLGGGSEDRLDLFGGVNELAVSNTETIFGSTGNDTLTLTNAQSGTGIALGLGTDTLNLANVANTVTVNGVEVVNGGSAVDTITVAGTTGSTVNGGAGNDVITLGSGSDIVKYEGVSEGLDTVNGFATGSDVLQFLSGTFNGNSGGTLDTNSFVKGSGAVALDGDDFFLFDTSTNTLSYDADGNGGGSAIALAVFDNGGLSAGDITFA